jgi:hypothetical protein
VKTAFSRPFSRFHVHPISLSDRELSAIFAAAKPLALPDRDSFLQAVAELLSAMPEPGEGDVHRAILKAQRQFFRPPTGEFAQHGRRGRPRKPARVNAE